MLAGWMSRALFHRYGGGAGGVADRQPAPRDERATVRPSWPGRSTAVLQQPARL